MTLADSLEVSVDNAQAKIDGLRPAAVDEQDRFTFPGSGSKTPGVGGSGHHAGADDDQVEGVDERGHPRGSEIDRRSCHDGETFKGDAVIACGRESKGGEADQRSP